MVRYCIFSVPLEVLQCLSQSHFDLIQYTRCSVEVHAFALSETSDSLRFGVPWVQSALDISSIPALVVCVRRCQVSVARAWSWRTQLEGIAGPGILVVFGGSS